LYARIASGEIVSKKEGRSRLISVPSLLEKYGRKPDQPADNTSTQS